MLGPDTLRRAWPWARKSAKAYAFGQAAVLLVVALLGLRGGQPEIMSANGVSAWQNPWPGPAGSAAALFAAASIVLAQFATGFRDRAWRRGGHALLLGWALFWLVGSARAANADPDALFVAALLFSFLGSACQAAVSFTGWPRASESPARPLPDAVPGVTKE